MLTVTRNDGALAVSALSTDSRSRATGPIDSPGESAGVLSARRLIAQRDYASAISLL